MMILKKKKKKTHKIHHVNTLGLTKTGRGTYSSSKSFWTANKAACQGEKGHLCYQETVSKVTV